MRAPERLIGTHAGLRGRPGIDLTRDVVERVVVGLVALLREGDLPGTLGVARDGRPESRALAEIVIDSASGGGVDVVDFGEVSTPAAKLACRLRGLGGAVIVTGSHLGPDWNGLKLVAAPRYVPVDVRRLPEEGSASRARRGRVRVETGAAREHAAAVIRSVDRDAIRAARLRVEASGGVGSAAALVLEGLGCLGPAAGALRLLLDPDGDRLQLRDERGEFLETDAVLPLTAIALDARSVVRSSDTSRMVDDLLHARGAVLVVPPGELHLVEALERAGADLAGEGNGGVVVPAVGLARDGMAAAVAILALLARTGRPLSELAAGLPRYARRRSTVPSASRNAARQVLARLAARLDLPEPDDPEVGLTITLDGATGLVRRSATEPVLRVTTEARTEGAAQALHDELSARLVEAIRTV